MGRTRVNKRLKAKAVPPYSATLKQRASAASLRQLEDQLIKTVLTGVGALHLIRNSHKPLQELIDELMTMEAEIGELVGQAMQMCIGNSNQRAAFGSLAGALSFIPLGSAQTGTTRATSFLPKPPRTKGVASRSKLRRGKQSKAGRKK